MKTKAVEEDRRAGADHGGRRVARRPVLPRHAADEAVLVPRAGLELRHRRADVGRRTAKCSPRSRRRCCAKARAARMTRRRSPAAPGSAAAVARSRIRPSATSSGIRSARVSCTCRAEAAPAGQTGGGAGARARWRAGAWRGAGGGGGADRARIASMPWMPPFARERREGALRGEQPHDVGRVQRGRQDAVRERRATISTPCASPIRRKHYEIAKGAIDRGRRPRWTWRRWWRWWPRRRAAAIRRSIPTPARCRRKRGPNGRRSSLVALRRQERLPRGHEVLPGLGEAARRTTSSTRSTSRRARRRGCSRASGDVG